MNLKTFIYFAVALIAVSCNNANYIKEYYPDGSLKLKIELNEFNIADGIYEEYYSSGEIMTRSTYTNGKALDTIYCYHKNGMIKEKGLVKDHVKNGWWIGYDSIGNKKNKLEYVAIGKLLHVNQKIHFNLHEDTIFKSSSFFKLFIPDTIHVGKNKCWLKYRSKIHENVAARSIEVIIDNQISENKTVKDTFVNLSNIAMFGVLAYKSGPMKIKGTIVEKIMEVRDIGKDSASITTYNYTKYFSKSVYAK